MITDTVFVKTEPSYPVYIGTDLLKQTGALCLKHLSLCKLAVISDSNVAPLYLKTVLDSLTQVGFSCYSFVFPAGEESKNLHTFSDILEFAASIPLTRTDAVIALGGGVTGDMAGFAAGCYLRGIRYIQIPTTLLADVDSSVGGKTAVDLSAGKNLAGLFIQPQAVICDMDCLKTLPEAVFSDGMAEVIKTAILSSPSLFSLLENGKIFESPQEIITCCIRYKADIVQKDEKEQNLRQLLNLGHTVAHAIEKCSDYHISHGRAVGIGLTVIAKAVDRYAWSQEPLYERIKNVLLYYGLETSTDFSSEELFTVSLSDKKRHGEDINAVIPLAVGNCEVRKIPLAAWKQILQAGLGETS